MAVRGLLRFLPLATFVLSIALTSPAKAQPVDYLVNGSFATGEGGWLGISEASDCPNGTPSLNGGLFFSFVYNEVTQDVVIPSPGQVTLTFTGALDQYGLGSYSGTVSDDDESVTTGEITEVSPVDHALTITTTSPDEVVTVMFAGVDSAFWEFCYGPIITAASLVAEPAPPPEPESTTTTLPPIPEIPSSGLRYITYQLASVWPGLPNNQTEHISSGLVSGLSFNWENGDILDTGQSDGVLIRFDGWISPPEAKTYYICAFTDDGFKLLLDGVLVIDDWGDRPPMCGGTADADFSNGQPKQLTGYYYENGGGAAAYLRYYTDAGTWEFIPDSWYSTSVAPSSTTTTSTTLPPETDPPVTDPPIDTAPPTDPPSTDTVPSDGGDSSDNGNEQQPEEPVDTQPPAPEEPPLGPDEPATPEPPAEDPLPEPAPNEENEEPQKEDPVDPPAPEEPNEEPAIDEPAPEAPAEEEPAQEPEVVATDDISDLSVEDIETVFSTTRLQALTQNEISDLISSIDPDKLSDEQAEAIANALSEAPDEVKQEFEDQINIYGGQFDSYVPLGSTISVGARRVIVGVTAVMFTMPTPVATRSRGKS